MNINELARKNAKTKEARTAAQTVFGKNNMAAGEYTAGLVPDALQLDASRAQETQDVLNRYNDISKQGLGSQEYQAERDQMNRGQNSALATNLNQLAKAQAQGKVYGAAAAAQQANALRGDEEARMNQEQQLGLKSEELKRAALGQYATQLGQAQNTELAKQQFNIGAQNDVTAARLGAFTNTIGNAQAARQGQISNEIAGQAINAAGGHYNPVNTSLDTVTSKSLAKKNAKKAKK